MEVKLEKGRTGILFPFTQPLIEILESSAVMVDAGTNSQYYYLPYCFHWDGRNLIAYDFDNTPKWILEMIKLNK